MNAPQNAPFQVRGYMLIACTNQLREIAGADAARIFREFPAPVREAIDGAKPGGWSDVAAISKVLEAIAAYGHGSDDRARELLVACGQAMAHEATNTFLRLLMRMLTTSLFAKKIPELWSRDCNRGRLIPEMHAQKLVVKVVETEGFTHAACTAAGFLTFALRTMGKSVTKTEIHGWSLAAPTTNDQWFQIEWSN